jgi:glycosyltransferase involved in cell wall biosynthesis
MVEARLARTHLYLASNCWDGLWIIQQPTANVIARDEPVLYVERFVSVFTVLRYPRLWPRLFTWLRGARRLSPTLRLLAPLPLFHLGHRFPWLFRLEFVLQRWWILAWARTNRAGQRVLWLDNPLYTCAVGTMHEDVAVYHVADEITAFATSHPEISEALETEILGKVDVVFAAAERLADAKRRRQPETHTVWNAIDTRAFAHTPSDQTFAELRAIPEPRAVFVGALDQWVDFDLLAATARRLPQIQFVLVGPRNVDDSVLNGLSNLHRLGPRDRLVVPGILRQCSVSLVPFKKTKLTERAIPLKIFEALAAGILPVCTDFSADLVSLERAGYAAVARTPAEFAARVEGAVAGDGPALRQRLAAFGQEQTWEARWAQMRTVLSEVSLRQRR